MVFLMALAVHLIFGFFLVRIISIASRKKWIDCPVVDDLPDGLLLNVLWPLALLEIAFTNLLKPFGTWLEKWYKGE